MKFKNPIVYVDRFYDLIKFAFDRKYNISGFMLLLLPFVIFILFSVIYLNSPTEKDVKNPQIFQGVIEEFKEFDSYRGGSGCRIKINDFSWQVLNSTGVGPDAAYEKFISSLYGYKSQIYYDDYKEFGQLFCKQLKQEFVTKKCIILKLVKYKILSEYSYCDGKQLLKRDDKFWDFLYFRRNLKILFGFILLFIFILICHKINKEQKNFNKNIKIRKDKKWEN
ncbi:MULTISPECIES: hypothetical protein [unclassified Campylobacter]|uniref:hypothetical protein n=1 Tax=unclassified Campylobacter TaxID=2593542 RepID=UPI0022E9F30C|nr:MULTISPECIES: hypothetical protein [unclassified Campylobacter]MDA3056123.1 hypothetical protein [Campylobacter sp. CN_NA1]MDA3065268.1 hypothetical protein [Campylobacter sp. CN_NE4]MDA3068093.1 hypothetical protein [Campylobacter sp. CN_NE3]MDA3082721.1 hypothetical protein [Campylobacter sp. CN_EL2]MDA3083540.1 hypothetical protein [Campylobacter sp. CN_NE1]